MASSCAGPGVKRSNQEELFQPFQRLHTAEQFHGTGLGLSIVAAIIEQHDGTVRLEQTDGGGATFTVRIPHTEPVDSRGSDS